MFRRHVAAAFVFATLTLATSTALVAQNPAQQSPPIRLAASSFATVEVHINQRPEGKRWFEDDASFTGPARIAIGYGQPHARGRKIVGGLIPNDTVWRFGANTATSLHTDVDMTLGGFAIPRGDYTLFLLHSGNDWHLVVSSQTAQWGTEYNKAKDFGRVALGVKTMNDNEETLTIYLEPETKAGNETASLNGIMRVRWGTTELSAPWTVKQ
jgi:hypothetical protein